MEDDKKPCPLKDECWCVSFSLNDEIQGDVCFFDTEKMAYEYCKEKAEQYSEESGRDLFNVSIYDPDEREVEQKYNAVKLEDGSLAFVEDDDTVTIANVHIEKD